MPFVKARSSSFGYDLREISLTIFSAVSRGPRDGKKRRRLRKRRSPEKRHRNPALPCRCCVGKPTIQKEPLPKKSEKCQSVLVASPSFWFGAEDPTHVKQIMAYYSKQVIPERPQNSRAPLEFIGCVKRQRICTDSGLQTLDEVEVFERKMVPMGVTQRLTRAFVFCTSWDIDDGFPVDLRELSSSEAGSMRQRLSSAPPSYLYALPVYDTDSEFEYCCRSESREVSCASSFSQCIYQSFLQLGRPVTPDYLDKCDEKRGSGEEKTDDEKTEGDDEKTDNDKIFDDRKQIDDDDEKKDNEDDIFIFSSSEETLVFDWDDGVTMSQRCQEKATVKKCDSMDISAYLSSVNNFCVSMSDDYS